MRTKEFWERFFHSPLQLALERDGHSIERLTRYILIHHDHHFLCAWADPCFDSWYHYDRVRRIVEPEYEDLLEWLHQGYILKPLKEPILAIAYFLGKAGAHDWSLKLCGWKH